MQLPGGQQRLIGDGVAGAPHLLGQDGLGTRRGGPPDRGGHAVAAAGRIPGHDIPPGHDDGVAVEWLEARQRVVLRIPSGPPVEFRGRRIRLAVHE